MTVFVDIFDLVALALFLLCVAVLGIGWWWDSYKRKRDRKKSIKKREKS